MLVIKFPAQRNISSLFTSQSHSARENLEKKPSLSFTCKISSIKNYLVKNLYSSHRMEIKLKLKEQKIQAELSEIKNRAEEKEIENGLKKINISKPTSPKAPLRPSEEAQSINIKSRTEKAEIDITYNTDSGLELTHETYLSLKKINMAKISQISPEDGEILPEAIKLPVYYSFS